MQEGPGHRCLFALYPRIKSWESQAHGNQGVGEEFPPRASAWPGHLLCHLAERVLSDLDHESPNNLHPWHPLQLSALFLHSMMARQLCDRSTSVSIGRVMVSPTWNIISVRAGPCPLSQWPGGHLVCRCLATSQACLSYASSAGQGGPGQCQGLKRSGQRSESVLSQVCCLGRTRMTQGLNRTGRPRGLKPKT